MFQVHADLLEWNMRLANKLIEFQGRVLPQEKILQGGQGQEIKYDAGPQTDWTKELRSKQYHFFFVINCGTGNMVDVSCYDT
jgi:hypothetical protein